MLLEVLTDPKRIYFDHNATTPLMSDIAEQVPQWVNEWGNPSSIHWTGREPKRIMRESRTQLARAFGVSPLELVFTSGGSEANNMVIKGIAMNSLNSKRKKIIVSSVEHPAVMQAAMSLKPMGFEVATVGVDRRGRVDLEQYRALLDETTLLVSFMAVNNETGHIYPIKQMTAWAHEVGALFHTDAVQALGKYPIDLNDWGVDFASFSSHKFYSLKGCGVLFSRRGQSLWPLTHGGGQERRRRAGTENVLAVRAFAVAIQELDRFEAYNERVTSLRDQMESAVLRRLSGVCINDGLRVGGTSSMFIEDIDGETLLMNLDMKGISVSTGAACSSGSPEPSPTLLAMGLKRSEAQSSLRVSLGWGSTTAEVELFVETLIATVERLRKIQMVEAHV